MYVQHYRGIYKYVLLKWCVTYFVVIEIACLFYSQLEKRKRVEEERINREVMVDGNQGSPGGSP